MGHQMTTSENTDYLRSTTDQMTMEKNHKMDTIKQGIKGDRFKHAVVCGACGVRLHFKAKKRAKYNYMAYVCKHTHREWVFHDYLCVKLRKIKEAIKDYVYKKEKDEVLNLNRGGHKFNDENALINIKTHSSQRDNSRLRPIKKTTPKKGDHNYNLDENDFAVREDSVSSRASRNSFEYSF